MTRGPQPQITHDDAHGVMVTLPITPTTHERQRAHRARRHVLTCHALAFMLAAALSMAFLSPAAGIAATLAWAGMAAGAAHLLLSHLPRCQPQPRWRCHTERDLPGLAELIGSNPDAFILAMATTDPARYNTRTLTLAIEQLTSYRDDWDASFGSWLKAIQLRGELIEAWKPVRDTALRLQYEPAG